MIVFIPFVAHACALFTMGCATLPKSLWKAKIRRVRYFH